MPLDADRLVIRGYLLGGLDEGGAAALEDRYVADPALLDAVRAEEEALIDEFVGGRLAPDDRARFGAHYLASPVHRDRVAIARALRERAPSPASSAATSPAGPWFYGWMATAAAVVLLSLWIVSRPGPAPQQAVTPPPRPSTPAPARPEPIAPPSPGPVAPIEPAPGGLAAARSVLALTLSPFTTRGGSQPVHVRPSGPVDLLLRLEGVPGASDRAYDAELQTVDGQVLWRGTGRAAPAASGRLTTLRVPADTLPPDDYVVVVTAAGTERGRYLLRLRARQ